MSVLVLRAPGFVWDVLNIDESDFYLYGWNLAHGGRAYVSFVEKKPPLVYAFYATLIQVGMTDLRAIRVWTAAWVLLGAFAVQRMLASVGLANRAAWVGAFVYGLFSSNISVATDCETLMNLPVVCATWLTLSARFRGGTLQSTWRDLAAGGALGVATGFKHQAGVALLAFLGHHVVNRRPGWGWHVVATSSGYLLVLCSITAWFAASGRLDEFLEWNVVRNGSYAGSSSPMSLSRTAAAVGLYGLANGVVFLGLGLWGLSRVTGRWRLDPSSPVVAVVHLGTWLYWTAWLGVSVGGRFYTHYFLQLVPGAALLTAGVSSPQVSEGWPRWLRTTTVALLAAAVVGFGLNTWSRGLVKRNFPSQDAQAITIAQQVRTMTDPQDRVYIWGYFNPVYYLAGRQPASRFINPSPIVGDFDPWHIPKGFDVRPHLRHDDAEVLVRDLQEHGCALFVDTAPADLHGWSRFPLSLLPVLERHIQTHFLPVGAVAGAILYRPRGDPNARTTSPWSGE